MRLLQLLFLLLFGYIIYQVIRFFLTLSRHARDARHKMEEGRERKQKSRDDRNGKVIELDKDQYKVD